MSKQDKIDQIVQHFIKMSSIEEHSKFSIRSSNPEERITFYQLFPEDSYEFGLECEVSSENCRETNEFLVKNIQRLQYE